MSDDAVATPDQHALIVESEFAKVLRVAGRDKNTLIDILRDAWDGVPLRVKTRHNPLEAENAHISIIGHCTREEVSKELDDLLVANGFANRFLVCHVVRANKLPFGGNLSKEKVQYLGEKVRERLIIAREIREVTWSEEARLAWTRLYEEAFEEEPGLAGAIVARGETQTVRMALIFALIDGVDVIDLPHLRAAFACWLYSEDSVRYVFGSRLGDPVAQRLLEAARDAYPDGLDGKTQDDATGGKGTPKVRKALIERGLLREEKVPSRGAGRPSSMVFAVPLTEKSEVSEKINWLDDPTIFPMDEASQYHPFNDAAETDAEVIADADIPNSSSAFDIILEVDEGIVEGELLEVPGMHAASLADELADVEIIP